LLVTVPLPVPALVMAFTTLRLSVNICGAAVKVAVQVLLAFMVTKPSVQSVWPLQLANTKPAAGVAVKVTIEPFVYDSEQSPPQSIPAGLLVTVPLPVLVIDNVHLTVAHPSGL
jgi:hypothetical protein